MPLALPFKHQFAFELRYAARMVSMNFPLAQALLVLPLAGVSLREKRRVGYGGGSQMAVAENMPRDGFAPAARHAHRLPPMPLYYVSGSIMFSWFRRKSHSDIFAEHMQIAEYRNGMDKFLLSADIKETLDTENEIRAYAVVRTLGAYQASCKQEYSFDETPFEHAVGILILAVQCVHMLYRLAYPAGGNDVMERKEIVIQNVMTSALEADHDNPSERAIGVMATATLLYGEIGKNHNQLVNQIDATWQRVFLEPSADHLNTLIEALHEIIRLQTEPSSLGSAVR